MVDKGGDIFEFSAWLPMEWIQCDWITKWRKDSGKNDTFLWRKERTYNSEECHSYLDGAVDWKLMVDLYGNLKFPRKVAIKCFRGRKGSNQATTTGKEQGAEIKEGWVNKTGKDAFRKGLHLRKSSIACSIGHSINSNGMFIGGKNLQIRPNYQSSECRTFCTLLLIIFPSLRRSIRLPVCQNSNL